MSVFTARNNIAGRRHMDHDFGTPSKSFRIMFRLAAVFIALTFVAIFAMAIFMFSNFANGGGYSYKVEYQVGNSSYSEETSFNR